MLTDDLLMNTTMRSPIRMCRGEGSWLVDNSGTKYLDFVQARGCNSLGHASRVVARALHEQADKIVHMAPCFVPEPALKLAELLLQRSGLDQVFFCNSGTEAIETAIKLARKWGRLEKMSHEIITFENAFHGRTWGSMSATGRAEYKKIFGPLLPGFPQAQLNDIASVEALLGPQTAAVMLELIQGESGVNCASREFLHKLRTLCDAHGVLLIFDEVQTGGGRLGHVFGYEYFGVAPDIVCLGKGIAGGLPLAAVLATRRACVFTPGDHGGTFNGSALVTAVGLAVLQVIREPVFLAGVSEAGAYLSRLLAQLSVDLRLKGVGGVGLMLRLDLGQPIGSQVSAYAQDELPLDPDVGYGLLLNSPRPNLIRFLPALDVGHAEIDAMVHGLRRAISHVQKNVG